MERVLKLSFKFDNGKKKAWSIPDPKTNLTKQQVETAMNSAMTNHFFQYVGADIESIDKYYIYETNSVYIN